MTVRQTDIGKIHWNRITPGRLLVVLLAVELTLFFSERFYPKGWALIFVTLSVGIAALIFLAKSISEFHSQQSPQYNIRLILIFTCVVAVLCGWMAMNLRQAARQRKVFGEHCFGRGGPPTRHLPTWLRNMLGDEFFIDPKEVHVSLISEDSNVTDSDLEYLKYADKLEAVYLRGAKVTDDGLKYLKPLDNLMCLQICDVDITDEGLKHLSELKKLQTLDLYNTRVNGSGLVHLNPSRLKSLTLDGSIISDVGWKIIHNLNQLEKLDIGYSGATDAKLEFLGGMHSLRWLDISGNQITDLCLNRISGLVKIENLFLGNTAISDAGLIYIRNFGQLKELSVVGTCITDVGVKEISNIKNLENIYLNNTKTTDDGLKSLENLIHLKVLAIRFTQTTNQGVARLQQIFPNCRID
jgi:hypothetical protein